MLVALVTNIRYALSPLLNLLAGVHCGGGGGRGLQQSAQHGQAGGGEGRQVCKPHYLRFLGPDYLLVIASIGRKVFGCKNSANN